MAGNWGLTTQLANATAIGSLTASSTGTNVTSSGSINTKGSWIQLIASTAADYTHLLLMVGNASTGQAFTAGVSIALDLAAAPAASEASGLIIQNLILASISNRGSMFMLPVGLLPAGTRVAARFISSTASDIVTVSVVGFDAGYLGDVTCGTWDTYGYSGAGAANGTAIDPGATANTKGSYVALTASTTNDLSGFFLTFDSQGRASSTGSNGLMLFDIALGAAASEKVILPNLVYVRNNFTGGNQSGPSYTPFIPMPIAAGTRISCRCQSATNVALDRVCGVVLYGARA